MNRQHFLATAVGAILGAVVMHLAGGGDDNARLSSRTTSDRGESSLSRRNAELEERVQGQLKEMERLRTEVARRSPADKPSAGTTSNDAGAPKPGTGVGATKRSKQSPRYVYRDTEKGLDAVSWNDLGRSSAALMPLLADAHGIAHGTKKMRPEFYGELTKHVGAIITEAIKGEAAGAAWEHPAFAVNLVHATLRNAGVPLTAKQEDLLEQIGHRFIEADARRKAGYNKETFELQKRVDSVRLHDGLYRDVESMLDDAQRAALYPAGVKGTVGLDLFSGSIQWDEHFKRIEHTDRATWQQAVRIQMISKVLRPSLGDQLDPIIAEWGAGIPDAYLEREPTGPIRESEDLEPAKRVTDAAVFQIALFKSIRDRVALTDDEREALRNLNVAWVPLRTGKG